jgi:hypothetical protein
MSNNNDYKNLKKLVNSLANNLEALENGQLSAIDIYSLLDDARNIHERMAILHYLAIEKDVKKEENKGVKFDFSNQEEEETHKNQTNLIDAIKVEHHIEAVRKSIGEQKPLFELDEEIKEEIPVVEKPIQSSESIIESVEKNKKEDEVLSINDKFSSNADHQTLADKLGQQPIKDLTKSIGLNQKFLFMNDLFEGENEKYKAAVETINNFSTFIDADKYINNDLKNKFNWDLDSISAQKFIDLVKRRFL